jgi:hypothetical protein
MIDIIIIMDQSGSMSDLTDDVVGSFNTFVEEQKKENPDARVTLVLFNHEITEAYSRVPLSEVGRLHRWQYKPSGMTALLDAIGSTIHKFKYEAKHGTARCMCGKCKINQKLVAIITDGYENSSREYSHQQVVSLIAEAKAFFDWEVVYLAAGQDAIQVGAQMGIGPNNCYNFTASSEGIRAAYSTVSASVSNMRKEHPSYVKHTVPNK